MTCCNIHGDFKIIIDQGYDFIKLNIKWFSQLIHCNQENILQPKDRKNINDVIGYCFLTKSKNTKHLKCVSKKHLAQLLESNVWNLFISLQDVQETKSFLYFKHSKLVKLLNLFIAHTNKPSYTGEFAITFNHDLFIPTLLHISQHSNHHFASNSIPGHLSYMLKCNHLELLNDNSTILDTWYLILDTLQIQRTTKSFNASIINTNNLLTLASILQEQIPTSSTWKNSTTTNSTLTYSSLNYRTSESSTAATTILISYPMTMESLNEYGPTVSSQTPLMNQIFHLSTWTTTISSRNLNHQWKFNHHHLPHHRTVKQHHHQNVIKY